jgi:hypothetical protein
LLGAILWQIRDLKTALIAATATGITALLVILPFYWMDPASFTPWIARKKLSIVDSALPWAGFAMIGSTALAATVAAATLKWRVCGNPQSAFFKACAWVTLCPMLLAVALQSVVHRHLNFSFMHDRFGLMYVFFALLAWGCQWFCQRSENPAPSPV